MTKECPLWDIHIVSRGGEEAGTWSPLDCQVASPCAPESFLSPAAKALMRGCPVIESISSASRISICGSGDAHSADDEHRNESYPDDEDGMESLDLTLVEMHHLRCSSPVLLSNGTHLFLNAVLPLLEEVLLSSEEFVSPRGDCI